MTGKIKYPAVVIGNERVGKTSIITRYCKNVFQDMYYPTLFSDLHIKRLVRWGSDIELDIWDIGGQEQYKIDREKYLPRAYVVIVTFAVDDVLSYMSLGNWMEEIKKYCQRDAKTILVANKIDLRRSDPACISSIQIENEAREHGFDAIIETSALDGTNIVALFDAVVDLCKGRESRVMPTFVATRVT
jgi:small GTP-binding protein